MRVLLLAAVVSALALPATAQPEFPLAGRWAFFDFGEHDIPAGTVAESCHESWDSISPDGAFVTFGRNEDSEIEVQLAGFCQMTGGNRISCTYLLDASGPIRESYADEIEWVSADIVDYVVRHENGKPDIESSWTYVRCPSDIASFR